MSDIINDSEFTKTIRYPSFWRLAATAAGFMLSACAGPDDVPNSGTVASVAQAYSDTECQAAPSDAQGTWDLNRDYTNTTPTSYGKAAAFKTFIWDLTPATDIPEVMPNLTIGSGLPASAYDTQAECTALSFNRRLYRRGAGSPRFELFGEAGSHGQWDNDLGCTLPRHIGPDIPCGLAHLSSNGHLICDSGVTPSTTIRVCVSARDANGLTVPVTLRMSMSNNSRFPDVWNKPLVRVSNVWQYVRAEDTSAAGYCSKHFETLAAPGAYTTRANLEYPYAFFNPAFSLWRVPLTDSTPQPVLLSVTCRYPMSH